MQLFIAALTVFARFIFCFPSKFLRQKTRQNASYMHFTLFPQLFLFLPLHLPLSLGASCRIQTRTEKAVGLFCEFIIVSVGFQDSHIPSTETPERETLSERTDHLRVVSKATLLAPSSTSSQQMEMQLRTQAARSRCTYL